jgi:G3E family GTPase
MPTTDTPIKLKRLLRSLECSKQQVTVTFTKTKPDSCNNVSSTTVNLVEASTAHQQSSPKPAALPHEHHHHHHHHNNNNNNNNNNTAAPAPVQPVQLSAPKDGVI